MKKVAMPGCWLGLEGGMLAKSRKSAFINMQLTLAGVASAIKSINSICKLRQGPALACQVAMRR